MRRVINNYIVADSEICHGKPTFKGTRIMVWQILDLLKLGESKQSITRSFPSLKQAHIKAALAYATSLTKKGYGENQTSQILA